jgi:hypothetical protein
LLLSQYILGLAAANNGKFALLLSFHSENYAAYGKIYSAVVAGVVCLGRVGAAGLYAGARP